MIPEIIMVKRNAQSDLNHDNWDQDDEKEEAGDRLFESPNFFSKYRHFIVLEASSISEEDQLTWEGLVESKVRHLVANLEREAISLAHVWPKNYRSLVSIFISVFCQSVCFSLPKIYSLILTNIDFQVEGCDKICCYWFIGLKVDMKEGAGGSLDLTSPIKAFTDIVMRSAIQINVWKTGDDLIIPADA